jgi:hypothetical protein
MNPRWLASRKSCVVGEAVSAGINAIARRKLTHPIAAPANNVAVRPTALGSEEGTNSNVEDGGEYGFVSVFNCCVESKLFVPANGTDHVVAAND